MKLFIICKRGSEYDDSYDRLTEGYNVVKAFRIKGNAERELARLTIESQKSGLDFEPGDKDRQQFRLQEIEVDGADVEYANANANIASLKNDAKELAMSVLKEKAEAFFAAHPEVEAFSWSQYTPYFNDGDTCTFGVNVDAQLKKVGDEEFQGEWDSETSFPKAVFQEASRIIDSIEQCDMLALFGDHVEVTCDRSGFKTDDYSHD